MAFYSCGLAGDRPHDRPKKLSRLIGHLSGRKLEGARSVPRNDSAPTIRTFAGLRPEYNNSRRTISQPWRKTDVMTLSTMDSLASFSPWDASLQSRPSTKPSRRQLPDYALSPWESSTPRRLTVCSHRHSRGFAVFFKTKK